MTFCNIFSTPPAYVTFCNIICYILQHFCNTFVTFLTHHTSQSIENTPSIPWRFSINLGLGAWQKCRNSPRTETLETSFWYRDCLPIQRYLIAIFAVPEAVKLVHLSVLTWCISLVETVMCHSLARKIGFWPFWSRVTKLETDAYFFTKTRRIVKPTIAPNDHFGHFDHSKNRCNSRALRRLYFALQCDFTLLASAYASWRSENKERA